MANIGSNITHLNSRDAGLQSERLEKTAHDFRSSLNIIIGFSELLLDEAPGKINDEQRRALSDIHDSGLRLLDIVNRVFDPSSPEYHKIFRC